MRTRTSATMASMAMAFLQGCAPSAPPGAAAAVIEDKLYTVTPGSVGVRAGIVSGEVSDMKVIERVEQGTGRIETAARLSATLKLVNASKDQAVRLVDGRLRFVDAEGKDIATDATRTDAVIKFAGGYGGSDRLDPGQESSQSLTVDFPAAALQAGKLKEIRLDLTYLPSTYRHDTATLAVSIAPK